MEHTLRCNALKCRKELNDRAIVTTCRWAFWTILPIVPFSVLISFSHVFCLDCSNRLHVITPPNGQRRICPACDAQLVNLDDAVIAQLNPSEDYKTSVLSGLNPNIIMECAGRALSFWAYQTTQEMLVSPMENIIDFGLTARKVYIKNIWRKLWLTNTAISIRKWIKWSMMRTLKSQIYVVNWLVSGLMNTPLTANSPYLRPPSRPRQPSSQKWRTCSGTAR